MTSHRRIRSTALLVIVSALAWACQPSRPPQSSTDDTAKRYQQTMAGATYAGDNVCASCHEELYTGFQEHGMANSFYPATKIQKALTLPSAPVYHEASDLYYRSFEQDGQLVQEEYRLDQYGKRVHQLVRPISYVVGSGTAALTFMTEEAGRLFQLPLTWYTQTKRWDFSPGYDDFNSRFGRTIPERCMACHNSYPESIPHLSGGYEVVPEGIGCERCHGPGSVHVDERLSSGDEDSLTVDYTIVNPVHLPLDLRLDVCQQCHLNADITILRDGRGPYSFTPGEPMASHVSLFSSTAENNPTSQINVISHADRMKQSECFLQTQDAQAPMDCVTCHNPHEGFRTESFAYFTETCSTCHPQTSLVAGRAAEFVADHEPTSNCISCHMPKVEAIDAPHSSFTDHFIRVVGDDDEDADAGDPPAELVAVFDESEDHDLYLGMAHIIEGRQQNRLESLERGVDLLANLEDSNEFGEAHFLKGLALLRLGRVTESAKSLEIAARLDDSSPERLNALAQVYEALARPAESIERLYRRALSIQPRAGDIRVNLGRFLQSQGKLTEARVEYLAAADASPSLVEPHFNLGLLSLQENQIEVANSNFRKALGLDPDHAASISHIGLAYAMSNRPDSAEVYLRRGATAGAGSATAQANLGAFLLNTTRPQEAVSFLERAVELESEFVDALANLALAYLQTDRFSEASTMVQRALAIEPGHPLASQIAQAL